MYGGEAIRYSRVLLITPPVKVDLGAIRPSIGLGYISEILTQNGIEHEVLDMLLGYSWRDLDENIRRFKPDLIGVSLFSNRYKAAYAILEAVKKEYPDITVVAGGPHVSCLRTEVLKDCPAVDFGVYLEGEDTIMDLCKGVPPGQIPNLIYRDGRRIIMSASDSYIADLDLLPFPKYERFEVHKYILEKSLITSRGCAFNCTYCAVKLTSGQKVRLRSPQNVVDEMQYWYEKGVRQFSFQDDNFTVSKNRVLAVCNEIERRGLTGLFLRCAGARADRLDREVLRRMRNVGFQTIAIGVEVGNDRMLKLIKKGESFATIDNAVRLACEAGFDVYLNFLAGVPYETLADVEDSVAFAMKYPIFYAAWSNIIPYPGTDLYKWVKDNDCFIKPPEEYLNEESTTSLKPVFETPELPHKERVKLLRRLKGVRSEVFRRAVLRRLEERGVPSPIRQLVARLSSQQGFMNLLFHKRLRRIADGLRFMLYLKSKPRG